MSMIKDISNFKSNPNFIEWMKTINHLTDEQVKNLSVDNYLGGWCEDWALYFAIRYKVPMLFLNDEHNIVKIDGMYFDAANSEGVRKLSEMKYVRRSEDLSKKSDEELESLLREDYDWMKYPPLANHIDMIEKVR